MSPDSYSLLIYGSVFIGPFVQEDTAVLYAAGLASARPAQWLLLFATIYCGLVLSDIWKYWIGWAALKHPRARAYAEKEHVTDMGGKVQGNLMKALMFGRFVPLARVPTYIACGYFKISYAKFCLFVAFTGFLYVSIVFTAVHLLGEVLGEKVLWVLPVIALSILAAILSVNLLKRRAAAKHDAAK